MKREYQVSFLARFFGGNGIGYSFTQLCWGEDECEALEQAVTQSTKQREIDPASIFVSNVTVKPTGRTDPKQRVFESKDTPYVKGLITRFWFRFVLSETQEELESAKQEFDSYVRDYEFQPTSLQRMNTQYIECLSRLQKGIAKPESYLLTEGRPQDRMASIVHYTKRAASLLRRSGYRVQESSTGFKVIPPSCRWLEKESLYTPAFSIILAWQQLVDSDRLPSDEVISYLGWVPRYEPEYALALQKAGVISLTYRDSADWYHWYVLSEDEERAIDVLQSIGALMYINEERASWVVSRQRSDDDPDLGPEFWESIENMME